MNCVYRNLEVHPPLIKGGFTAWAFPECSMKTSTRDHGNDIRRAIMDLRWPGTLHDAYVA